MGLFDKVKNLFTEEVEEEIQPIKKEVRQIEVPTPKKSIEKEEVISKPIKIEEKTEERPTREEKFVFFSDDDFKDLEKPKKEEPKKVETKEEKPLAYKGALPKTTPEPKKEFKPSPIISPVYGVLDKNYKKDEIKTKKNSPKIYRSSSITIDDVRNKAYGTLEDDIKDDLLGRAFIEKEEEPIEADINIFEELEKYEEENDIKNEEITYSRSTSNVDEIFGKLDNKKDEILDELDNKKDEILDELDNKKNSLNLLTDDFELENEVDINEEESLDDVEIARELLEETEEINDVEISKELLEEETIEDDTEELAKELEQQKKKLEEINSMMNENKKTTKNKKKEESVEDDLEESELFDLIDSMYEKKDDE